MDLSILRNGIILILEKLDYQRVVLDQHLIQIQFQILCLLVSLDASEYPLEYSESIMVNLNPFSYFNVEDYHLTLVTFLLQTSTLFGPLSTSDNLNFILIPNFGVLNFV